MAAIGAVDDVRKPESSVLIKDKQVPTGKYWTRSEKRQWALGLFCGTAMLYSARTIMPMCVVSVSDEMGWDKTESGTVLSAFFWGYTMTQFLGGYLSDRVGGDVVLPIAACLWSLITFWTPQLAYLSTDKHNSLYIVVLSRVMLGICQVFESFVMNCSAYSLPPLVSALYICFILFRTLPVGGDHSWAVRHFFNLPLDLFFIVDVPDMKYVVW